MNVTVTVVKGEANGFTISATITDATKKAITIAACRLDPVNELTTNTGEFLRNQWVVSQDGNATFQWQIAQNPFLKTCVAVVVTSGDEQITSTADLE